MKKFDYKYYTKIFEPLGYIVFNRNLTGPDSEWFDLFVKNSNKGMEWFGEFSIVDDGQYKLYRSNIPGKLPFCYPEDLIKEISAFNETRLCPAYCYSPVFRPAFSIIEAFTWYMNTLGFEYPRWDEWCNDSCFGKSEAKTMVLRNIYGEILTKITCVIDDRNDNTMKGHITRSIGSGWSWTESEFDGIDEMIGAVNSILEPELLLNAATAIKTSNSMTDDRSDNISVNKVDGALNMYKSNAKNAIKNALEKALKNLE